MRSEQEVREAVRAAAKQVRETNPLAGSVTNGVTVDFVANAQLAVGGSAAMVYLPDEGEFLVAAGGATYVNLGTLLPVYEQTVPAVGAASLAAGKPWVLDPVGIGIGSLRTKLILGAKGHKPAILRGNASEIIAVARMWGLVEEEAATGNVRGVDTTDPVDAAREAAVAIARYTGGAVAVSGPADLVTDGYTVARTAGGSALMEKVTGFGCSLGGVMAVYATAGDAFTAALAGAMHYNVAGLRAAAQADAPASYKVAFIDELFRAQPEDVAAGNLVLEEA